MMLVDSHCHLNCLNLNSFVNGLDDAIHAAQQMDVKHMLCVCIDIEHFPEVIAVAERYPHVYASVGLHPTETAGVDPTAEQLIELAQHPKVIAIGETGLDFYRCDGDVEWQRQRFRRHIMAAKQTQCPLIIHTRQASADTIDIMRQERADEIGGVMHCFTESYEVAKQALDLGFYISFSGIITFKNAVELRETVKKIPLDQLLVETDAPYLAPVPYRGKPNQPAYVRYVAECVAELKDISYAKVAEQTTANFFNLFTKASANTLDN